MGDLEKAFNDVRRVQGRVEEKRSSLQNTLRELKKLKESYADLVNYATRLELELGSSNQQEEARQKSVCDLS